MSIDEEVPDSQDEAELRLSPECGSPPPKEQHTLSRLNSAHTANTSLPSSSFSSFVLPLQVPSPVLMSRPLPIASSTISQFTTGTTTLTGTTTERSAISVFPSSSSASSSKPRPKPRPAFARANANPAMGDFVTSPSISTIAHQPHALPPPQMTFSSDISERIKARRASQLKKKSAEAVIEISSDESPPPRSRSRLLKPQSPDPLNLSAPTHISPSIPSLAQNMPENPLSSSASLPRKRPLTDSDVNVHTPAAPEPPPKKKRKHKAADVRGPVQGKKDKAAKTQAASVPPRPEKEKEQFKSREFIDDSDDELNLALSESANATNPPNSSAGTVAVTVQPANPPGSHVPVVVAQAAQQTEANTADNEQMRGEDVDPVNSSVKLSANSTTNKKRKKAETPRQNLATPTDNQSSTKKAKRGKRKVTEETPAPGKNNYVEPIPDAPPDAREDVSQPIKKKKASCTIIEDGEDRDAKENVAPAVPKPLASKVAASPNNKEFTLRASKPSYIHPPKNRPLSSILQLVNGPSPRFRASPAVSRKLLSRIVPLHPNRRSPPPPPPPRVIPKKTKKELEREEKWEEELQETEGWCQLGEDEREKMRRAKRDWELGLYEE